MCDERLARFELLFRRRRRKDRCESERLIDAIIRRLEVETDRPNDGLGLFGVLQGRFGITEEKVALHLPNPMIATGHGHPIAEHPSVRRIIDGCPTTRLT